MALEGYPQEYLSPDVEYFITPDSVKNIGPYSMLKVTGDDITDNVSLTLYFDKAGFDSDTDEGVDFTDVKVLVTDMVIGPIYGFKWTAEAGGTTLVVIASKYSTGL